MDIEVSQSVQQVTYDQFHKLIKEQSANKSALTKTIIEILENPSLNSFAEFLQLKEIDEVCWLFVFMHSNYDLIKYNHPF